MQRMQYAAYLYIFPIMAFFVVFLLYPLVYTFRISLFEWNGLDREMTFVGLGNYAAMLGDPVFWKSLLNFLAFACSVIALQMLLGFALAYAMRKPLKLFTLYKAVVFIPVIMTPVVVSYVFSDLLASNDGLLNESLRAVGLDVLALSWLGDPKVALFSVIAVTIWMGTGFSMSVYVSSLTTLPGEVLEAAKIDGAGRRRTVVSVVWPMLRSTHLSLTIIGAISALKIFDIVFLMTRGGPIHSTEMLSTYMFNKAFGTYEQGFASAVAVVIVCIAIVITMLQLRASRGDNV